MHAMRDEIIADYNSKQEDKIDEIILCTTLNEISQLMFFIVS